MLATKASCPPDAGVVTVPASRAGLAVAPAITTCPPLMATPLIVPPFRSPRSRVAASVGGPEACKAKLRTIPWPPSTPPTITAPPSTARLVAVSVPEPPNWVLNKAFPAAENPSR